MAVLSLFAVITSTWIAVNDAEATNPQRPPSKAPPAGRLRPQSQYSTAGYPHVFALGIREANLQTGVGVIALWVYTNEPAFRAGIQWGDTITSVDGKRVASLADLNNALAAKAGRTATLNVLSQDGYAQPLLVEVPVAPKARRKLQR
jgi:S1-C subfamily serine protease